MKINSVNQKIIVIISSLITLVLFHCNGIKGKPTDPVTQYQTYCGNCHLAPDPTNIPKSIWKKNIFPKMAARLGYQYNAYDPFAKGTMEENLLIRMSNIYPKEAMIDSIEWQQIHDYVINLAPDSIAEDRQRSQRNKPLVQFKPTTISLDEKKIIVGVTNVQFDTTRHNFMIGDVSGNLYRWPETVDSTLKFASPITAQQQNENALFVTAVGYMNPAEKPLGEIYRIQNETIDTLAQKLHRPVHTTIIDINEDGKDEIFVCEFGNLSGQFSMLIQKGSRWEKTILLPLPGAVKIEVVDMNQDGKKDIVVLATQGKEGIFILYQERDLQFRLEQVFQLGPEYGSSWFQLIDYNGDEHLDIVLVNGDNADLSIFLKPYHGLRLLLNNGHNEFTEAWFYPIYGATQVLCEDYDLDGDLDFAVMSFFPDFKNSHEEGFVWLENKNANAYIFEAHTHPKAKSGRWMVMDDGDFDQDGDIDILLGSFILPMNRKKYASVFEHWRAEKKDLLFLENKAIK